MEFSSRSPSDKQDRSYERISPTAWFVAYQRTLSDIPFSQEIFLELQENIKLTGSAETEDLKKQMEYSEATPSEATPLWEARFKIVNHILKTRSINQIIEIAAGVSPRGLEMTKDSSMRYVEVDLPKVIQEKKGIIERLIAKSIASKRPNLHLEAGNALNLQDLLRATRFFEEKPIAVINEGFLQYLGPEEITVFAKNVHQLLARFGGVWITPDISTKAQDTKVVLRDETVLERAQKLKHITGVDVLKNRFENEDVAQAFFENLGFRVERHNSIEVIDELVTPQRLNLHREQVEKIAGLLTVFVMEINSSKP